MFHPQRQFDLPRNAECGPPRLSSRPRQRFLACTISTSANMAPLHWTPSSELIRNCAMNDFRKFVNERHGLNLKEGDYWSLHAWTIKNPETINQFWNAIWDFSGIIGDKGEQPVRPRQVASDAHRVSLRHADKLFGSRVSYSTQPCRCTTHILWRLGLA